MSDELTRDIASLQIDRSGAATHSGPPRRSRGVLVVLVLAAVIVVIGLLAYPHLESAVFRTPVRVGQIIAVSPAQGSTALTATGYIVPQKISNVAPKAFGRVARVAVREGDFVREGQLLYELEASDQSNAVSAARSRAAAARSRVAAARASLSELELQIARKRRLVAEGAEAKSGLEDAEARARGLLAEVKAAEADAAAATDEVNVRLGELSHLRVTAPINGTVLQKPLERGEIVGPEDEGLAIADLSTLAAEVDVPEARLGLIRIGGPCEIVLDAFPTVRFRGVVSEIGHRIDRAKATIAVKVRFADSVDSPGSTDSALPNMSARVGFLTESLSAEALRAAEKTLVPASAVVERGGRKVVFVIEENGVARETPVTVGARSGDSYELKSGPAPRTRVALDPPPTLQDGRKIKEEGED